MKVKISEVIIPLDFIKPGLLLGIYGNKENTIFKLDKEFAAEAGEETIQIFEGNFYNYYFKSTDNCLDFQLKENAIIKHSPRSGVSEGRISPNTYVGSLPLEIYDLKNPDIKYKEVWIEIIATKLDINENYTPDKNYHQNYQLMLNEIALKCTDLIMQVNSPVYQNFEVDFNKDNQTIYQRFAFIHGLINNEDFNDAVYKILSSPTTRWKGELEERDIRSVRRLHTSEIRQIASKSNRYKLEDPIGKLHSLPIKIHSIHKTETIDTNENRFIKYALQQFAQFCTNCKERFNELNYHKSKLEAAFLEEKLENYLNLPFFKEINRPQSLKLNSPALQRKSGYREILNSWLQFELAAKLIWKGSEDFYKAGKRDIAVLYEYWLFFTLYDLVKAKFKIDDKNINSDKNPLITSTKDGLSLMLKYGKETAISGTYENGARKLKIRFSYNRTFRGGASYAKKKEGSWTKTLRPDYTLSIWPSEIDEKIAEEREIIVHIHFDSKYKVEHFNLPSENNPDFSDEVSMEFIEDELNKEKNEERQGTFKNADLLKMHAYKDAIRRTGGAYILYPGTETQEPLKGFHEIIPGLGAFAIKPGAKNEGLNALSNFIDRVILNLLDRASQREYLSVKTYDIFKNSKDEFLEDKITPNIINKVIPEFYDKDKKQKIIPDETFVIVGYCKDGRLDWVKEKGLYNFRMDDYSGNLLATKEAVLAKYLLIREAGNHNANTMFKITGNGPTIYTKQRLIDNGYINPDPTRDLYLVINVEMITGNEFDNVSWEFEKLDEYQSLKEKSKDQEIDSGMSFTTTLTELMKVVTKS